MIVDRRTKIVGTMGPASSSPAVLRQLIEAGLNVARLNFSHGSHSDHLSVMQTLRSLSAELKAPVTIVQDLQGPKIRVGEIKNNSVALVEGHEITITTDLSYGPGDEKKIPTPFQPLPRDVKSGDRILLDDGNLELEVIKVAGQDVQCQVIVGGELKSNKGMSVPGARLSVDPLTEKDLKDLEFGLDHDVDFVALSFVRHPQDIRRLREIIDRRGKAAKVIAKIEKVEALDNLDEIAALSDAVMVARGDLAVEIGQQLLPGKQKKIIRVCNKLGRPVIVATQMLDSMIIHARPTRAEITDVANAVLDGADAVMLSAETASGKYPVRCVSTMDEIIQEVERTDAHYYQMDLAEGYLSVAEAIAESACLSALKLNASAIVCLTTSGKTATLIARRRPRARIIAVTHAQEVLNRLELVWGIHGIPIDPYTHSDEAIKKIEKTLVNYHLCQTGDKVVITMGQPVMERGTTNSMKVLTLKENPSQQDPATIPLRCR